MNNFWKFCTFFCLGILSLSLPMQADKSCGTPFVDSLEKDPITFNADLLFWAFTSTTVYAYDQAATAPATGGKGIVVPTKLQPGYRVGFEYPLFNGCSSWNLRGDYMWLYSGLHNTATSSDLVTNLSSLSSSQSFNSASAKLGLHLNVGTVAATKKISLNRRVFFRPAIGLMGASIVTHANFEFVNTDFNLISTVRDRQQHYGVGPHFGTEFEFMFAPCWSFIARTVIGAPVGEFRSRKAEEFTNSSSFLQTSKFACIGIYILESFGIITNQNWNGFCFNLGVDWDVAAYFAKTMRVRATGISIKTSFLF